MPPRVTVLMPVYNGLPYLREAIESVLCQTFTDFEFLIVDDASTDGSTDLIKSYGDSRIRLIRNEHNLGTSGSMNRGIELACAEYIARIDQDDVCLPERLREQLAFIESRPDLEIVCSWEVGIDSSSRRIRNWTRQLDNYGAFLGYLVVGKCPIWHPSIMFRRQVVLEVGGYNHSYSPAEDFELTMRLAMHRHSGGVVPKYLVMQRQHESRQSVQRESAQWAVTQRVHDKMIRKFYRASDAEPLGQFLRMEDSFWRSCRSKEQIGNVLTAFHEMLRAMENEFRLSGEERTALRWAVIRRLGLGSIWGRQISRLPSLFFFPLFFSLSPMMVPGMRRLLSHFYEAAQELRYPARLFRSSVKRLVNRGA